MTCAQVASSVRVASNEAQRGLEVAPSVERPRHVAGAGARRGRRTCSLCIEGGFAEFGVVEYRYSTTLRPDELSDSRRTIWPYMSRAERGTPRRLYLGVGLGRLMPAQLKIVGTLAVPLPATGLTTERSAWTWSARDTRVDQDPELGAICNRRAERRSPRLATTSAIATRQARTRPRDAEHQCSRRCASAGRDARTRRRYSV